MEICKRQHDQDIQSMLYVCGILWYVEGKLGTAILFL